MPCKAPTCTDGACGWANAPAGTPCDHCGGDQCNANGSCVKGDTCTTTDCPWTKGFGDWHNQLPRGLVVDSTGAVIVCGLFEGVLDFDGEPLAAVPSDQIVADDGFVAKLAATGHHQWSLSFGSDQGDSAEAVAVGPDDRVLVAGYFGKSIELGGSVLTSEQHEDVLVAALDTAGKHVWSQRFGGPGHQLAHDVAVDGAGDVVVVGHFDGTMGIESKALVALGAEEAFVAKLDSSGMPLWSRAYGGSGYVWGWRVAVDAAGGVVAAGTFDGNVDFGGGPLTSAGSRDVFVLKLDVGGYYQWSRRFGGWDAEDVRDVIVDPAGNIFLAGSAQVAVDLGGGGTSCDAGGRDAFIVKLDAAGQYVWSRCFGSTDDDVASALGVDPSGYVAVTGWCRGWVNFGGVSQCKGNGVQVFLARYSGLDGAYASSKCYGGFAAQRATNLVIDPWGHTFLAGFYGGTIDFGSGAIDVCAFDELLDPPMRGTDLFITKLAP